VCNSNDSPYYSVGGPSLRCCRITPSLVNQNESTKSTLNLVRSVHSSCNYLRHHRLVACVGVVPCIPRTSACCRLAKEPPTLTTHYILSTIHRCFPVSFLHLTSGRKDIDAAYFTCIEPQVDLVWTRGSSCTDEHTAPSPKFSTTFSEFFLLKIYLIQTLERI